MEIVDTWYFQIWINYDGIAAKKYALTLCILMDFSIQINA